MRSSATCGCSWTISSSPQIQVRAVVGGIPLRGSPPHGPFAAGRGETDRARTGGGSDPGRRPATPARTGRTWCGKPPRVVMTPAGLEPAASGLGIPRSIHLSYGAEPSTTRVPLSAPRNRRAARQSRGKDYDSSPGSNSRPSIMSSPVSGPCCVWGMIRPSGVGFSTQLSICSVGAQMASTAHTT
jgi:hypothetical protein